ncbi:MAG: S53 family peptidase [Lentilactobacillus diolivorans]|jgi:subtilase family serine protease|nr:S53 family peptidase [Lentilactobacillus hilgardii]EEI72618.1 Pro-kumamolisin, activation domain protein [Lentilactobacillus hilgardii ATCC 27305]MCH4164960.1 S53 family peptidase [Lentilactobacillus diolivorans]
MKKVFGWIGLVTSVVGSCFILNMQVQAATSPLLQASVPGMYKMLTTAKNVSPTPMKKTQTTCFDIVLKPDSFKNIRNAALAVSTPGNADFKHYLTPGEFGSKFGASETTISQWQRLLKQHSLKARPLKNQLIIQVSGKVGRIDKLFRTNLNTARYHSNPLQFGAKAPKIPGKLSKTVWTVVGLTDHSRGYINTNTFLPFRRTSRRKSGQAKLGFTSRFTNHYHVAPLYRKGMTGKGQTTGIIAFEGLRKSNVFHFWKHEKVDTNSGRLMIKQVASPLYRPKDVVRSSDETTMDAEYAGSVAPKSNVRVYLVNNPYPTLTNFVDVYEQAFNDNVVSSTTNSWGLMDSGTIAILRHRRLLTPAYRQLLTLVLAQGAIQGVSNFTASGDAGAYNYMIKSIKGKQLMFDRTLSSSDFFDSNPFITSVGGTTLPFRIKTKLGSIVNRHERAWGSDYVWPILQQHPSIIQRVPISLLEYTAGSTGGFSHQYDTPAYQMNVPGVNTFMARNLISALGQPVFGSQTVTGTGYGRNYPDVSADSDAVTGYWIYQKTKKYPKKPWSDGAGTSIASPQYAAAVALINSQAGRKRMGFWNPQIYQLAQQPDSPFTPLNSTQSNSNLYYVGQPGTVYNQATGLGITNFDKLAQAYK